MNTLFLVLAIICTIDIVLLVINIMGKSAPAIVEWLCYILYFIPLPLFWGIIVHIMEALYLGGYLIHCFM